MTGNDLTSIPGLQERHRWVLAMRLGIATCQDLAGANPETILGAVSRVRPRPTLDQIKEWQGWARAMLSENRATATWERLATFVLSFEQRRVGEQLERRLVAEQTELEPEQMPTSWPGWGCDDLCLWLRRRLGAMRIGESEAEPDRVIGPQMSTIAAGRSRLSIARVAIVDAAAKVEVISADRPSGQVLECSLPCWLEVLVGGDPSGEVQLALRLRQDGERTWNTRPPSTVETNVPARLDLGSEVPGRYHARLIAWAADASAEPVGVDLGLLTILPPLGQTTH